MENPNVFWKLPWDFVGLTFPWSVQAGWKIGSNQIVGRGVIMGIYIMLLEREIVRIELEWCSREGK